MRGRAVILVVLMALVLVGTARVVLGGSAVAELRSAPSVRANARVDGSVTDAAVAELGRTVEPSASRVELATGRR